MPLSLQLSRNVSWRFALHACKFLQTPELYLPPSKQHKVCFVVKRHSLTKASRVTRKERKKGKKKRGEERPQDSGAPCARVNARWVLHPSILVPRGRRGAVAEPSSVPEVPSLHSAMGSCKVWGLSHTAEGHTNHFDQIKRSTKITQDQGEELKPI